MCKKKVAIIGALPESLLNFRGALLRDLVALDLSVITVSCPLSEDLSRIVNDMDILHYPINFERNGLNPFVDFVSLLRLYTLIKREKPDLLLCYTVKPVIFGGLVSRIIGVQFYPLITGLGFVFKGKSFRRKVLRYFVSFLYKISLDSANGVIFQNVDNRLEFVRKKIVDQSKTHVVNGSGVDVSHFYFTPVKKIKNNFVFLCVARLLGDKGLRDYYLASKEIKSRYPNTKFLLVGPEDTSPDKIPLDEVKSWDEIDYHGSTCDVRPFIESAHVFVLPSYHEGLPRSTLEAMSMGRPIITTNAVGCRETVIDGVNGYKFPVGNVTILIEKMRWFVENPEIVPTMGKFSRKIVEDKFDVKKVNINMIDIMGLSDEKNF